MKQGKRTHKKKELAKDENTEDGVIFLEGGDVTSLLPTPKDFVNCKNGYLNCSGEELKAKAPLGTRPRNLCELITLGYLSR